MDTTILIIILAVTIIAMVIGFVSVILKLRNLEQYVYISITDDIGKLKKVAIGNYVDIVNIKKNIGMKVDDSESGDSEKSKES